jgi:hypothetical protein
MYQEIGDGPLDSLTRLEARKRERNNRFQTHAEHAANDFLNKSMKSTLQSQWTGKKTMAEEKSYPETTHKAEETRTVFHEHGPTHFHEHGAGSHPTSREFHHYRANVQDYHEKKKGYVHRLSTRHFNTSIWKPFDRLERWKKILTSGIVVVGIISVWWGVWGLLEHYLISEMRPFNYMLGVGGGLVLILITGEVIESISEGHPSVKDNNHENK